jgi:hypothetical protein
MLLILRRSEDFRGRDTISWGWGRKKHFLYPVLKDPRQCPFVLPAEVYLREDQA